LPFDFGNDVDDTALAAVIWHVPLGAEEFGGLLLLFSTSGVGHAGACSGYRFFGARNGRSSAPAVFQIAASNGRSATGGTGSGETAS
jgi:hypothetical protein